MQNGVFGTWLTLDRAIQDTYPWRHKPDTAEKRSGIAILCRKLAAKLTDPNDRRATELMASAWEKVADERETKLATKQDRDRYRLAPLDVGLAL